MATWVAARTGRGRPTLMHVFRGGDKTPCGADLSGWSKSYHDIPIAVLMCRKCAKHYA